MKATILVVLIQLGLTASAFAQGPEIQCNERVNEITKNLQQSAEACRTARSATVNAVISCVIKTKAFASAGAAALLCQGVSSINLNGVIGCFTKEIKMMKGEEAAILCRRSTSASYGGRIRCFEAAKKLYGTSVASSLCGG